MTHEVWGDQPPALAKALDAGLELAPGGDRLAVYLAARQALLDAALTSAVRHELLVPADPCPDTVADLLTAREPDTYELKFNPQSGGPE